LVRGGVYPDAFELKHVSTSDLTDEFASKLADELWPTEEDFKTDEHTLAAIRSCLMAARLFEFTVMAAPESIAHHRTWAETSLAAMKAQVPA
jgi:hypothetical protein